MLIGTIDVAEEANDAITNYENSDYFDCGVDVGEIIYTVADAIAKKK